MIRIQIEQEEFQGEFRLAMSKANPETLQMMFTYLKKWIHEHSLPELRRFYEQLKSEGFNVNRSDVRTTFYVKNIFLTILKRLYLFISYLAT